MSYPVSDTVRSFADGTGVVLGCSAAAILGYLSLGDWMLRTGMIGSDGHFAGVVIAFVGALVLSSVTAMIFMERLEA